MIPLLLLFSCSDEKHNANTYSTAICTAIEDCDLLTAYGYADNADCMAITENALTGLVFADEYGEACLDDVFALSCNTLVEQPRLASCEQWHNKQQ